MVISVDVSFCVVTVLFDSILETRLETRDHLFSTTFILHNYITLDETHGTPKLEILGTGIEMVPQLWRDHGSTLQPRSKIGWDMAWTAGIWAIWRERNDRFFKDKRMTVHLLVRETTMEIKH